MGPGDLIQDESQWKGEGEPDLEHLERLTELFERKASSIESVIGTVEEVARLRARLAEAERRCDKYHDEYLSLCKQSADWRDKADRLEARVRELEGEVATLNEAAACAYEALTRRGK